MAGWIALASPRPVFAWTTVKRSTGDQARPFKRAMSDPSSAGVFTMVSIPGGSTGLDRKYPRISSQPSSAGRLLARRFYSLSRGLQASGMGQVDDRMDDCFVAAGITHLIYKALINLIRSTSSA